MRKKIFLLLSLVMLSAFVTILVWSLQSRLVDIIAGNVILAYLGVGFSIGIIILALGYRPLRPYPLIRICIVLWPGVGVFIASGVLLGAAYASASYADALFIAALIMVAFFLIQLLIFPFAVYQVYKRPR